MPPTTIELGLREALAGAADGRVRFPRDFHGFPGTVHGGAVAALFHRATTPEPPVHLRMSLQRSVPVEARLHLGTGSAGPAASLTLDHGNRRLAEASLSRERLPPADPRPALATWQAHPHPAAEIPGTTSCLACGSANPLGLQIRLLANEWVLWREYAPREAYRKADGSLHPALAMIVLDELGWWLGALHQGECGVTTEVEVTVLRPLPFAPLWVLGDRTAVRTDDDDPRGRYARAEGFVLTKTGDLLAVGRVLFAGSRAYTKRLLDPFLEATDAETLCRFFPSARALIGRR